MGIVDQGAQRRPERGQGDLPGDSRFSQLCLRKLYVLCSRGAEASAAQGCLLQVGGLEKSLSQLASSVRWCMVLLPWMYSGHAAE